MPHRFQVNGSIQKGRRTTRRSHIVEILVRDILSNSSPHSYPLESEHQLCRRFQTSRVTVRLALSELESRGLIYRRHGIGTFAHGRSTQIHRNIGVLVQAPFTGENRALAELLRGVQNHARTLRSSVIIFNQMPQEWQPELVGILAGVIVMTDCVTSADLDILRNRKLPFFLLGETKVVGPRILVDRESSDLKNFFLIGQRAAEELTHAFLCGIPPINLRATSISTLPSVSDM